MLEWRQTKGSRPTKNWENCSSGSKAWDGECCCLRMSLGVRFSKKQRSTACHRKPRKNSKKRMFLLYSFAPFRRLCCKAKQVVCLRRTLKPSCKLQLNVLAKIGRLSRPFIESPRCQPKSKALPGPMFVQLKSSTKFLALAPISLAKPDFCTPSHKQTWLGGGAMGF